MIVGGITFHNQEKIEILQRRQHQQFAVTVGCQEKVRTQVPVEMPVQREPGNMLQFLNIHRQVFN
jgi:hypothetical protein